MFASMVIHNLNIKRISFMPGKADSPLPVNADCILTLPVSTQRMESIPRVSHKGLNTGCSMKHHQQLSSLVFKRLKTADSIVIKKFFSIHAWEGFDHA